MNYLDLMNLENIYLNNLNEPQENFLRLTFIKSKTNVISQSINIGNKVIKNVNSINYDYTNPLIQIDFESYIGYSILNESFTSMDNYEEFEGKSFRICRRSRYLDFIKVGTFASKDYPGTFKHYGIVCLNHIIDIVSVSEPVIKEIQMSKP
ncbi:hypothetical protein [Clostridium beijerinckii]|uniref:hypothetical protein n=1 Tax=Clostridium beijerinckii TaxID=1520 RepID=UPI00098C2EBA|nr:hypothetical protein [Clostridium beijerinckii]NRT80545.1 hypothetical protein [Clostridium beijerinckii]OOM46359.1 hypothetical protein CBEIJ_31070 [Clostridium beijerinckii]